MDGKIPEKIKEEERKLTKEIRQRTLGYIAAALGLVAGLAWNEAVKSLIDYFLPAGTNTLLAKFIYAMFITFVVVVLTVYLDRILKKE